MPSTRGRVSRITDATIAPDARSASSRIRTVTVDVDAVVTAGNSGARSSSRMTSPVRVSRSTSLAPTGTVRMPGSDTAAPNRGRPIARFVHNTSPQ